MKKNKKSKENYTFLVEDSEDVKRLGYKYSQRNMLGYLVFKHNYYSDYRAEHNGFFFVSSNDIQNAVGITKNTVTMYAMRFLKDGVIDYSAGKRHYCSEYRLKFDFQELDVHNKESQPEVTDIEDNTEISGNQYCKGENVKESTSESVESEEVAEISGNQYYESGENDCEKYESTENESNTEISGNQNKELRIKNEEYSTIAVSTTEESTVAVSTEGVEEKKGQDVAVPFNISLPGFWKVTCKGRVVIESASDYRHMSDIALAVKRQLNESPLLSARLQDPDFLPTYIDYVVGTVAEAYQFPKKAVADCLTGTLKAKDQTENGW